MCRAIIRTKYDLKCLYVSLCLAHEKKIFFFEERIYALAHSHMFYSVALALTFSQVDKAKNVQQHIRLTKKNNANILQYIYLYYYRECFMCFRSDLVDVLKR